MAEIGILITGNDQSRRAFEQLQRGLQGARREFEIFQDQQGRFRTAGGQFVSTQRAMAEGFRPYVAGAQEAARATEQLHRGLPGLATAANTLGRDLGDVFVRAIPPIRNTESAIRRLSRQFVTLVRNLPAGNIELQAAAMSQFSRVTVGATRALIGQATQLERLTLGLRTLSPSIAEAEAQYRRLIEVARLPGIDLSNALQASQQLQALGFAGEEVTRVIQAFGNALALSGANVSEIQRTIFGIRQIIADGRVLQRELNIITSRVPTLIPILNRIFGGVRAEDIRAYFDAIGVEGSGQATMFLEIMTRELEKLPSASETVANQLENLGDTFRRVQGVIGTELLPAVSEAAQGFERLLFSVERGEEVRRSIADWTAFGTTMVATTAAVLGLASGLRLLLGASGVVGAVAAGAGLIAGAFVQAEVRAARFRREIQQTDNVIREGLRRLRDLRREEAEAAETESQRRLSAAEREVERFAAQRQSLIVQARQRQELAIAQAEATAGAGLRRTQDIEDVNVDQNLVNEILEADAAYQTLRQRIFQVTQAIRIATDQIPEFTQAVDEEIDTTAEAFQGLAQAAAGTPAEIANALQTLEGIAEGANEEIRDLALDLGDQLINIATATTSAQVRAGRQRVAELLRDNSQIEDSENRLAAIRVAIAERINRQLLTLFRRERAQQQQARATTAAGQIGNVLEQARAPDATPEAIRALRTQYQGFVEDLEAVGVSVANVNLTLSEFDELLGTANLRVFRQSLQTDLSQTADQISDLFAELRDPDISEDQFDALNDQFEELVVHLQNLGVVVPNIDQLRQAIEGLDATRADRAADTQLLGIGERTLRNEEQAFAGARQAYQDYANERNDEERQAIQDLRQLFTSGVRDVQREATRIEGRFADARSARQLERVQRDNQQFLAEARALAGRLNAALQDIGQVEFQLLGLDQAQTAIQGLLSDAEQLNRALQVDIQVARLDTALRGLSSVIAANLASFGQNLLQDFAINPLLDAIFGDEDEVTERVRGSFRFVGQELEGELTRLERIQQGIGDRDRSRRGELADLDTEGFIFDPDVYRSFEDALGQAEISTTDFGAEVQRLAESIQITRLEEDARRRLSRLSEDAEERQRQLVLQRRRVLAGRPAGDQRGIERTLDRAADINQRIAEARREADRRAQRTQEDFELRRNRTIEDALNRALDRDRDDAEPSRIRDFLSGLLGDLTGFGLDQLFGDDFVEDLANAFKAALEGLGLGDEPLPLDIPEDGLPLDIPEDGIPIDLDLDSVDGEGKVVSGLIGELRAVRQTRSTDTPIITGLPGQLSGVALSDDTDKPTIDGLTGVIDVITQGEDVEGRIEGLLGVIGGIELAPRNELNIGDDVERFEGILGIIDRIELGEVGTIDPITIDVRFNLPATPQFPSLPVQSIPTEYALPAIDDIDFPNLPIQDIPVQFGDPGGFPDFDPPTINIPLQFGGVPALPTISQLSPQIIPIEWGDVPGAPDIPNIMGQTIPTALGIPDTSSLSNLVFETQIIPARLRLHDTGRGDLITDPNASVDESSLGNSVVQNFLSDIQRDINAESPISIPTEFDEPAEFMHNVPTQRIAAQLVLATARAVGGLRSVDDDSPIPEISRENYFGLPTQELDARLMLDNYLQADLDNILNLPTQVLDVRLNKLFTEPIDLSGVINAVVRVFTGAQNPDGTPFRDLDIQNQQTTTLASFGVSGTELARRFGFEHLRAGIVGGLDAIDIPTIARAPEQFLSPSEQQRIFGGSVTTVNQRIDALTAEVRDQRLREAGVGGGQGNRNVGGQRGVIAGGGGINIDLRIMERELISQTEQDKAFYAGKTFANLTDVIDGFSSEGGAFASMNQHLSALRIGLFGTTGAAGNGVLQVKAPEGTPLMVQIVQGDGNELNVGFTGEALMGLSGVLRTSLFGDEEVGFSPLLQSLQNIESALGAEGTIASDLATVATALGAESPLITGVTDIKTAVETFAMQQAMEVATKAQVDAMLGAKLDAANTNLANIKTAVDGVKAEVAGVKAGLADVKVTNTVKVNETDRTFTVTVGGQPLTVTVSGGQVSVSGHVSASFSNISSLASAVFETQQQLQNEGNL